MSKNKKLYNYEQAEKLGNYVRRRYKNQLSNGALQLYFSLPYLERDGLGLCQPITANYTKLANASFGSKNSIQGRLAELKGVLCEVKKGSPIKNGKQATQLRRFSLSELMNGEPKLQLINTSPDSALRLADILRERSFFYGGEVILPNWNVLKTGRVQSSRPNIQGDPEDKRRKNLCEGLEAGEVLIHADFKSAEPTIIQQATEYAFQTCPYDTLAKLQGIERKEAKRRVNMLAYATSAIKIVLTWEAASQEEFMPYANALDAYKEKLWRIGKPKNDQRRFVHTLGGSKIVADRGDSPHRGQVLNWHIQGTVADIVNATSLKIIDQEKNTGWRFGFLVHDAVYVIGKPEHVETIRELMEMGATALGLSMVAEVDVYQR